MDYIFKYFISNSNFFNNILKKRRFIYFTASYLKNFNKSCYNLIAKKKYNYFIDPETYKFQYGGSKMFYVKYIEYFNDLDDLFDDENRIKFDFLENEDNKEDFYNKIIQFQRRTLAQTSIPLDYYFSIASGNNTPIISNPNANRMFVISPYFEFNNIGDFEYRLTLEFSKYDKKNYALIRCPKTVLTEEKNIETIFQDFSKNSGILLNIIELNEYNLVDLDNFFPNLISLIKKFSDNNQKVIMMNNSEFSKYFSIFGLNYVCSNVMIGQKTNPYDPEINPGGNLDFFYVPEIERSVSFNQAGILKARNPEILTTIMDRIDNIDFNERVRLYHNFIDYRTNEINSSPSNQMVTTIQNSYNKLIEINHREEYRYYQKWITLIKEKKIEFGLK